MFSCKNGDNNGLNTVTPGGYASLDDIFARTAPLPTTQSIVVSSGGEVVSKGGTHIIFPKDAFQSYSGAIVTGSVDVKVYDWLKKGDMVFGKVLPVSDNELLYTSGQAYIEVTQRGVPVRLRKGYKAYLLFPQFNQSGGGGDSLFLGQSMAGSVHSVNWYTKDTAGRTSTAITDTVVLATDSFRYVAASHFLPITGYNNFTVRLNTPITLEQSVAVALFDDLKSVYPVSSAVNGTVSAQHIPDGKLHLAVMGVNKGVFYAGIAAIPQPKTDSTYEVLIKQVDPQNFRLQMNAL